MSDEAKGKVPHNVMGNPEAVVVQEVFSGIASMEWRSFVTNRLPLLKLPIEILESVRQGKIAYTKAQTIARVKDEFRREKLLKEAITQELSLAQIKERIAAINTVTDIAGSQQELSMKEQFDKAFQTFKKSKVWDDPKKKKKLERLLAELTALANEK
jgi:ParB family chromosome partitioning protein